MKFHFTALFKYFLVRTSFDFFRYIWSKSFGQQSGFSEFTKYILALKRHWTCIELTLIFFISFLFFIRQWELVPFVSNRPVIGADSVSLQNIFFHWKSIELTLFFSPYRMKMLQSKTILDRKWTCQIVKRTMKILYAPSMEKSSALQIMHAFFVCDSNWFYQIPYVNLWYFHNW